MGGWVGYIRIKMSGHKTTKTVIMTILNAYEDSSSFCQPSTMYDLNYDNRLPRKAVMYHFSA